MNADRKAIQSFTVFLGIYNGEKYLESLAEQLLSQEDQNFNIVVVDNASTDNSWSLLQPWQELFREKISLHRNPSNLGAGGSLDRALKEKWIKTDWFASFHQDDFYLPNHVSTLTNEINKNAPRTVAICTSMGSMDEQGRVQSPPPRSMWLTKRASQVDSFLINLRTQTLSWPASAFKTDLFIECFAPWHSPSFSDTETTLLMSCSGEFKYLGVETMNYRENPQSESHVIKKLESVVGSALGLARVFGSEEFKGLVNQVEIDDRRNFFMELVSSIKIRLGENPFNDFITLMALEELTSVWSYSELSINENLAIFYKSIGSKFTSELLSPSNINDVPVNSEVFASLSSLASIKGQTIFESESKITTKSNRKNLSRRIPLKIRIIIFRAYVHIRAIKEPNYYWNSFWK